MNRPLFNDSSLPKVNISEDDHNYFVELSAPGYAKEDIKVNMENNTLTVSAEVKSENKEEGKTYSRREYRMSSFSRSFHLPEDVQDDKIQAGYENGILKLELPKKEEEKTIKKNIEVK